jgi:predicted acylesterase/phospholipase RssA
MGGGAHGAFTWRVLDRLLEEKDLDIVGVSGTSAGAVNEACLVLWAHSGRTDGGYLGNPAMFPLFRNTQCRDLLLIRIDSINYAKTPTQISEIADRARTSASTPVSCGRCGLSAS